MKRITISVPDEIADKAARAVAAGEAPNVSAYFVGLAHREPDWAMAREAIAGMIEDAGGLDEEAYQWALNSLGVNSEDLVAARR